MHVHARVIITNKTINRFAAIDQCHQCHSHYNWAPPPLLLLFLYFFFACAQTKTVVASHGDVLLASAACTQRVIINNNHPVPWWQQLMRQQVIRGVCYSNATASDKCCLCHSTEVFISFFDCFAFAQTKYAVPPASGSGGISWRWVADITRSYMQRVIIKNNQPVQWWHRLAMQQVILLALVMLMPPQVSYATYVTPLKILFLSFTVLHLLKQKKNICGATSKLQWRHLVEAQVSTACKQKVII